MKENKHKSKIIPSTHDIIIECAECKSKDKKGFTNAEIYRKVTILQWCKKCNKSTTYKQTKQREN